MEFQPLRLAALCMIVCPGLALAQADQSVLKVLEIEARSYESLENTSVIQTRSVNLQERFGRDGAVLLDVRLVLDVAWTEDLSRVSANSRDITVLLPDGTASEVVGGFEYVGMPMLATQSFSKSRPSDWPEVDEDLHWRGLFMVPEGVETVTLSVAGDYPLTAQIAVPPPGEPEAALAGANITLAGLNRYRRLQSDQGRDASLINVSHVAPKGMVFLDLDIRVDAVASNSTSGDDYFGFWSTTLRLTDGGDTTFWPVGQRAWSGVSDRRFSSVDVNEAETFQMIWLVPESLTSATLWFASEQALEITIDGSILDEG